MNWSTAAPVITAAFLGAFVEVVEAFTIVLAVATVRGWRPAAYGTAAGLLLLTMMVASLGPVLEEIPLRLLQFVVGVALLMFGLRWLRKAILRSAGFIALHDEEAAFEKETSSLQDDARQRRASADWIAGLAAFKAVVLEGIEVVFIVVALGSGPGLLVPASIGAVGALVIVLMIGALVHRPLSRVPENLLKFGVGVMLSAFGVFWTGEGLGVDWLGQDAAILVIAAAFLGVRLAIVPWLRRLGRETAP